MFESAKEKTPRLRSLCFPACVLLFLLSSCRCCVLVSTLPTAAVRSLTLEKPRPLSENARIVVSVPFISSYARSHVHLSSFAFQVQLFLRHALVQAVFRRRVALARREQSGHAEFQIPSVFGGVTLRLFRALEHLLEHAFAAFAHADGTTTRRGTKKERKKERTKATPFSSLNGKGVSFVMTMICD